MYLVQFKHQTTNLQYKSVIVIWGISKLKHHSLDLDFRLKCASYILSGKLIYILCSPGDSFGSEINEIGNINSFFLSSQLFFCTYPKHIMVLFIGAQVCLPPCILCEALKDKSDAIFMIIPPQHEELPFILPFRPCK